MSFYLVLLFPFAYFFLFVLFLSILSLMSFLTLVFSLRKKRQIGQYHSPFIQILIFLILCNKTLTKSYTNEFYPSYKTHFSKLGFNFSDNRDRVELNI